MNETKRVLTKISAILSIISGSSSILGGIMVLGELGYFGASNTGNGYTEPALELGSAAFIIIGVICILIGACALIGGIFLLSPTGKRYVAGCVLTIIGSGGLSLPAILLYVSFALKDNAIIVEEPQRAEEKTDSKKRDESLKKKMEILREMRKNGEISDQEFKQMMLELLNKY